jgi:hypothetical protein
MTNSSNIYNNGGNVGIGTSSPAQKLDVNGVVNSATGFTVAGGTPSTSTYLKGDGTNFVPGSIQTADIPSLSGSYVDLTNAQTAAGVKTWSSNANFNGGTLALGNAASNIISYNVAGAAVPAFTTRSAGTKLVLYPLIDATHVDYAIGLSPNTIWYSLPQFSNQYCHAFYGDTFEVMRIQGDGTVGIRTANPGYPLDVNGVIHTSQGFNVGIAPPSTSTYLKGNGTNFVAGSISPIDVPTLNQNTTGSAASFTSALAGDVTGTQGASVVGKIQTTPVTITSLATNNFL